MQLGRNGRKSNKNGYFLSCLLKDAHSLSRILRLLPSGIDFFFGKICIGSLKMFCYWLKRMEAKV